MSAALTGVRARKTLRLLRHPRAWRAVGGGLKNGVFPSFEHTSLPFGSDFVTVFDVGTSRGQFALFALWRFRKARLICFEPLPEAAAAASHVLPSERVEVHSLALGSYPGDMTLHVSARDDSSSLLPIGPGQVAVFPGTHEERELTVPVDVLENYLTADVVRTPCLLKIDVQGGELDVLRGAGSALDLVDEVLVELSFVELYSGQPLAEEVVSYLGDRDLRLVDISEVAKGPTGEPVQAEFLFRRGYSPTAEPTSISRLAASDSWANGSTPLDELSETVFLGATPHRSIWVVASGDRIGRGATGTARHERR